MKLGRMIIGLVMLIMVDGDLFDDDLELDRLILVKLILLVGV